MLSNCAGEPPDALVLRDDLELPPWSKESCEDDPDRDDRGVLARLDVVAPAPAASFMSSACVCARSPSAAAAVAGLSPIPARAVEEGDLRGRDPRARAPRARAPRGRPKEAPAASIRFFAIVGNRLIVGKGGDAIRGTQLWIAYPLMGGGWRGSVLKNTATRRDTLKICEHIRQTDR